MVTPQLLLLSCPLYVAFAGLPKADNAVLVEVSSHADAQYSFSDYMNRFGRNYEEGSDEFMMRKNLFEQRVDMLRAHNARQLSWHETVNEFTDRTDSELQQSRGYKRHPRFAVPIATSVLDVEPPAPAVATSLDGWVSSFLHAWPNAPQILILISGVICLLGLWLNKRHKPDSDFPSSAFAALVLVVVVFGFLLLQHHTPVTELAPARSCKIGSPCDAGFTCNVHGICERSIENLPSSVDWSDKLPSGYATKDQGACGSCWATAAAGILQLYGELVGNKTVDVSPQGMLGCAPNPLECGGQGGCQGSTPELALDWAALHGIHSTKVQKYTATNDCPKPSLRAPPSLTITGYMLLETNKGRQVLDALVLAGPLIASIAASSIHSYGGGVFDGCPKKNPVVDHSVMMMGYGVDGLKYWKIRNSWGAHWGERGFFRLRRHTDTRQQSADGDEEPCAWDEDPSKGYACKDPRTHEYPKRLMVCGECGILSDTLYPVGVAVGKGA